MQICLEIWLLKQTEVESTVEGVANGSGEEPSCSGWSGSIIMPEERQDVMMMNTMNLLK